MDILSYLTELIKTRKEVGISGLGTFYKKKSPGRYDVETHSFLPPSYTLAFMDEAREVQSLINYISKKRNLSTEAATYYIDQFTEETVKQLSEKQYADFGEIGTLSGNLGSLTFNPKDALNFGFDFYGLPPLREEPHAVINDSTSETETVNEPEKNDAIVEQTSSFEHEPLITEEQLNLEDNNADLSDGSEELEVVVHQHEERPASDDQPVYEEISEVSIAQKPTEQISIETPEGIDDNSEDVVEETVTPRVTTPPFFNTPSPLVEPIGIEEESQGLPFYLKIIIAFTVIVLIGLAAYFIKPDLFNGVLNKSENTIQDNSLHDNSELIQKSDKIRTDSIAQADSIRISNEKAIQTADSIKKDSLTAATVKPVPTPVVPKTAVAIPEGPTTWEVIGASVINQKEADKFIAQMKAIGITAKVIPTLPGKRRLKISIATFKDEESAREGRKLLVTKLKDPGIYIHQNTHTHKPQ
nr:SPOR domain-containing protein [Pedobacter panaciterrae]